MAGQLPDPALDVGVAFDCLYSSLISCSDISAARTTAVLEEVIRRSRRGQQSPTTAPINCNVRMVVTPRIAEGSNHQERLQPMALGTAPPSSRASAISLKPPLTNIRHRLLAEDCVFSPRRAILAELRISDSDDHTSRCLDHVAAIAASYEHQQRHADGTEHGIAQRVASASSARARRAKRPAWRPGCAAASRCRRRSIREGRQYQRGAAMMNQVLDLLALDDVPLGKRVVETFLRRVFCFVVGIVGHRGVLGILLSMISAQTRSAFVARETGTHFSQIMLYFNGVNSCITPMKC